MKVIARAQQYRLERAELILIRIGQHIFHEWRDNGRVDIALENSFEAIWELKREIRAAKRTLRTKPSHIASPNVVEVL